MQLGDLLVKIGADFTQYNKDLAKAEGMARKSGTTIGDVFKNAIGVGLGISLTRLASASVGMAKDFVLTAGRTDTLNVALEAVATSARKSMTAVLGHKNAVMDMGIAEQEATQILTRFMQAQLDTADAAKLARVAQDAAVVAGYNSSEAAEQMTEAIAKQRPQLLAAFGMTRNLNDIYADYAKTAGKTANKLTEAEKKQAMLNYILKEGEKVAGAYEKSMGSAFKKLGSLTRYWDTFKNAIATPLALPSFGEIIDLITNALKNAIKWAETNKAVLEAWGKTIATSIKNGITTAWNAVSGFFNFIRSNWNIFAPVIKGVLMLFISFKTVTLAINTAKTAMATFGLVQKALAGESLITSGILGFVSTAMGIYRVQMRLAAMEGIVLTGVLAKIRVALYSVWTALGPVGWVVLAIAGALGIGISLWNRYSNAMKAVKGASPADLAKGFRDVEKSSQAAADGIADQTDAMEDAKKAAKDNLTTFDEINKLQADMGDATGDMALDTPTLDEMVMPEMPDMGGIGGMLADIEAELPPFGERVKGFFGWMWDGIKTGAVTAWNGITGAIKTIWTGFVNLTRPIWQPVAEFFSGLWSIIADDALTWWEKIKGVLLYTWKSIVNVTRPIWEPIGRFFSWLWDGIKTVTMAVWDFIKPYLETVWNGIATVAKVIWNGIRTFLETTWSGISTAGQAIWNGFAWFFISLWNGLNTFIRTIWAGISQFLSTVWNGIKNTAVTIWNSIKTAVTGPIETARNVLSTVWNGIKYNALSAWSAIRQGISNTSRLLYNSILNPFDMAKRSIDNIIRDAYNWGKNMMSNIVDGIKSKISAVKNAVSNVASTIKGYIGFSSPTKEGPGRYADEWAPNLIKMYAEGIIRNTGLVESAAGGVAGSLSAMNGATINEGFEDGAGSVGGDMTIIVKLGDDTITEKVISNINRRSRISGKTVITV